MELFFELFQFGFFRCIISVGSFICGVCVCTLLSTRSVKAVSIGLFIGSLNCIISIMLFRSYYFGHVISVILFRPFYSSRLISIKLL
jgi:hypothetical protein